MAQRSYTVYLEGGASFTVKAARFEKTPDGIIFYGEEDRPLEDTYIDPKSIIAVIPPVQSSVRGSFPSVAAG